MIDGGSFETITTVTKATAGTQLAKHSFTDNAPAPGKNYYRIKALQQDGKEVLTNTKFVNIGASDKLQLLNTYPNPTSASFNIALVSPVTNTADIKVFNASTSVQVLQKRSAVTTGINNISLDVKSLPSGVYFVVINAGNETIRTRLVKH
jgi:hypothetical protein